jgi:hypothetical protein
MYVSDPNNPNGPRILEYSTHYGKTVTLQGGGTHTRGQNRPSCRDCRVIDDAYVTANGLYGGNNRWRTYEEILGGTVDSPAKGYACCRNMDLNAATGELRNKNDARLRNVAAGAYFIPNEWRAGTNILDGGIIDGVAPTGGQDSDPNKLYPHIMEDIPTSIRDPNNPNGPRLNTAIECSDMCFAADIYASPRPPPSIPEPPPSPSHPPFPPGEAPCEFWCNAATCKELSCSGCHSICDITEENAPEGCAFWCNQYTCPARAEHTFRISQCGNCDFCTSLVA